MRIGIIGSGHVGLVTGAGFADLGNEVLCMDHDVQKIKLLKRGEIPFYEPGLQELVQKNCGEGRLFFSADSKEVLRFSKVLFLCVGTPPRSDGDADLSAVEKVAREIGRNLAEYRLIVEKSTVPVQTGEQLYTAIKSSLRKKVAFDVASNAEFLREGSAVQDFFNPDRIVLGVGNNRAKQLLLEIYKPFKAPIVLTDIRSAEIIKHACNSFLATKVSFINLISQICEKVGADVVKVAEGIGTDHRIGRAFLDAGIGFGGSCFPKDLAAFAHIARKHKVSSSLLQAVSEVNETQKLNFVSKVKSILNPIKGKTIAVLGLAFKPNTDDLRSAPAIDIVKNFEREGAKIKAYDPQAIPAAGKVLKGISFAKNAYEACRNADALVILTEWREFRELDLRRLKQYLKRPIVIDGRNIYDVEVMRQNGFKYFSVGRK
ncbi:MAG: UDP-glucose/GDP-mannose dehydrogenase family protein [Candidatus Omnitrophica bacterium]|nr:UDP-glucose/GDP-mannose dehydrogenase family protein [Candidatus Omnitrophota bacterium]